MPDDPRFPPNPRVVAILAYPAVQLLDVAGPLQVFTSANELAARDGAAPLYAPLVVSADAPVVTASAGLGLVAAPLPNARAGPHVQATFSWDRFFAIQLWIFVLFLIYVTATELNRLFGHGELSRIFFTTRPSELQLNRRERVRELTRLSKLADAHSVDEFRDPTSIAHTQLIEIVRRLAVRPRPPAPAS